MTRRLVEETRANGRPISNNIGNIFKITLRGSCLASRPGLIFESLLQREKFDIRGLEAAT